MLQASELNKNYCTYCWPTKRTSHFSLHFDYYNDKFFGFLFRPLGLILLSFNSRARDIIWGRFLEVLTALRLIKFTSTPDESKIHDRSLMFFQEAKKRGLDIEVVWIKKRKAYGNDFRFAYKGKRYYYESIPLTMYASRLDLDDKIKIKRLLKKENIPIADGKSFVSSRRAIKYAEQLGYPLAVKPNGGSLSMHVTVDIKNAEQLREAVRVAKIYQPSFIVERFIPGNLYRATVIAKKQVFVCQREGANVTGDGETTIGELIKSKNLIGNRTGQLRPDGTMAFEIDIEEILEKDLLAKGLNLDTIPKAGEKIYLTKKFTPQSGNDIVIFTDKTHEANKQLFLRIAEVLDADVVGIDVICEDIAKSYMEQQMAIIETNSVPYTNVHQYPSEGKSEPVAQIVWDIVLGRLDKKS
jgi:cyanophycin synthetase